MGIRPLPDCGSEIDSAWQSARQLECLARCGRSGLLLPSRNAQSGCRGVAAPTGRREREIAGRRDRTLVSGSRPERSAILRQRRIDVTKRGNCAEAIDLQMAKTKIKFLQKPACSTCRKAKEYLEKLGAELEPRSLDAEPLSEAEIDTLIGARDYKLFLSQRNELYRT